MKSPISIKDKVIVITGAFGLIANAKKKTAVDPDHIRCNATAPHGIVNDPNEQLVQNFSQLSPASGYLTGSILTIDGGWTAI